MTATNTFRPAKDGNAALFDFTMAAEGLSGKTASKTYIGSPSTELLIEPAQDGADGTGITPPAGSIGIRGWLSGIYDKLSNSLLTTQGSTTAGQAGVLMQCAITAAPPAYSTGQTRPLSGDPAGNLRIVPSIIGRTTMAAVTPAVTLNGAYAAGKQIGGKMTFPVGAAGSGTLMSLRVTSKSILTTALKAYIFTADPSSSTFADRTAPAINAADIPSLLAVVSLNTADSGLGAHTMWNVGGIGAQFAAANLYVVLIAVSAVTLTSASASDITVQLGIAGD